MGRPESDGLALEVEPALQIGCVQAGSHPKGLTGCCPGEGAGDGGLAVLVVEAHVGLGIVASSAVRVNKVAWVVEGPRMSNGPSTLVAKTSHSPSGRSSQPLPSEPMRLSTAAVTP